MYLFAVRSLDDGSQLGGLGRAAASGKTLCESPLPLNNEDNNILIFIILIPPRNHVWVRLKKSTVARSWDAQVYVLTRSILPGPRNLGMDLISIWQRFNGDSA